MLSDRLKTFGAAALNARLPMPEGLVGPDGLPGVDDARAIYFVQPEAPQVIGPAVDVYFETGDLRSWLATATIAATRSLKLIIWSSGHLGIDYPLIRSMPQ